MPQPALLPRATPAAAGVSSRAVAALLDRLEEKSIECHSLMVVRHGQIVAEGWWSPYSADRPHLLYSMTKSFTSIAVGMAITDGLLSLDDRVVDVLPDHVPVDLSDQGRRITVHHLLSMTAGHATDSLEQAWEFEPDDLVKGFLRLPFAAPEGTLHTYDNATTFILARMVERVTRRGLEQYLGDRLFVPMGIDHADWDRVASGAVFGFHGLHLTTEAVAAFGELLLRGGRWRGEQLVPREWVESATRRQIDSRHYSQGADGADFLLGYGYQFWMSRHGFHANGAFGQHCVVMPQHDLVVVVTSAQQEVQHAQDVLDAIDECLLDGIGDSGSGDSGSGDSGVDDPARARDDEALAARLRTLALPLVQGEVGPRHPVTVKLDASAENSALVDGASVTVEPVEGGWSVRFDSLPAIAVGYGEWRQSSPLGRPICANGAWQADTFVADLYVIMTPHCVRLRVDAGSGVATATWRTTPLTSARLALHLRSPLMTRPDVA